MRHNFSYIWAVYAFFIQWNQILLMRRANTGYNDWNRWVPSWHMDGNELVTDAAMREISEELWVTIQKDQLSKPITLFRMIEENNERFEVFFPITQRDGEIINNEPHKCDMLEWFSMDDLPDNTIPYIKIIIQAYNTGKIFVEINEKTEEIYSL